MFISEREAAARLATIGMPRRQARLALGAGLAGEPIRTRAATLYDDEQVDELLNRPLVARGAVFRECPRGLFLDRRVDAVDDLRLGPLLRWGPLLRLGPLGGALLGLSIRDEGPLPYVATVCGFVVLGGEIVAVRPAEADRHRLDLAEPGTWFDAWRGRRWPTGRGREWSLVGTALGKGVAVGG
jgi:hypothetical protein